MPNRMYQSLFDTHKLFVIYNYTNLVVIGLILSYSINYILLELLFANRSHHFFEDHFTKQSQVL